ncbi:hypothetical protein L9F63_011096, partial [Diploptera punctata]
HTRLCCVRGEDFFLINLVSFAIYINLHDRVTVRNIVWRGYYPNIFILALN